MSEKMPEEKKNTKKRSAAKKEVVKISRHLIFGDVVSSTFFKKNKFTIFIVIALLMAYITSKYECMTKMEEIRTLERELAIVKSKSLRERGIYRSNTRESVMQHRIDSIGLPLLKQRTPPFKLSY
ncbi:MAG: FtsL-like putative cell division protein [Clostridium sp.]|nr:FtsL-like putative cell division protein [Clostridium sp.]